MKRQKDENHCQNHCHIFICGLVYPAFLGAFLFEAAERFLKLIAGKYLIPIEHYAVLILLIVVFVFDYLYTADKDRKIIYNCWRMIIDVLMVALLYTSLKLALAPTTQFFSYISYIWMSLAFFKACSLLWELFGTPDTQKCLAIFSSGTFFVLYVVGWLVFSSVTLALILILLLDILTYKFWKDLSNKWKRFRKKSECFDLFCKKLEK